MSIIKISDSGGREVSVTNDNALKVDPSGTTQPVILTSGNNVVGQIKITDGIDVADILDLPNSNPIAVAIVDASGDQITSFGGGTQYTEDVAAAADPVGTMSMAVRADSLAAVTSTDGDNIAARATNKGEIYVKHVDSIPVTDNGGSITVDGSVTVTQATGTNLHTVVDSGTITTITNVVHVDDNGSTLSVDDGGSTISVDDGGGSITVDGTITANAGTGFPSVQTEDAASAGGETGTMILGVRNDSAVSKTSTDGDFSALAVDAAGRLGITDLGGSISIDDNSGSLTVDAPVGTPVFVRLSDGSSAISTLPVSISSGATSVAKAEDVASADGDVGVPAMAIRKATPANTSGTDGDYEMLQMSAGRLWASATIDAALPAGTNAIGKLAANDGVDIGDVTINNASGASAVNIQDGGNSITVDYATIGSGTATGAIRVELPTNGTGVVGLNTGTNSIGKISDITTAVVPGTGATNLGKAEDAVAGSGDTGVFSLSVANESQSALAGDGDYIARAADTKGNSLMVGNLAHDAVDAGNPVKIGAQARQTNPTAVADGDRVNITADDLGRQVVVVGQVRDLIVDNTTTISSSTSETTILTAVASTFLDIRCLWVSNTSAMAVRVDFRDATGGSVRFSLQVPAGDTRGFVVPTAIKQTTVNNNWTAQSSVSVADLRIYIQAEKNI